MVPGLLLGIPTYRNLFLRLLIRFSRSGTRRGHRPVLTSSRVWELALLVGWFQNLILKLFKIVLTIIVFSLPGRSTSRSHPRSKFGKFIIKISVIAWWWFVAPPLKAIYCRGYKPNYYQKFRFSYKFLFTIIDPALSNSPQ